MASQRGAPEGGTAPHLVWAGAWVQVPSDALYDPSFSAKQPQTTPISNYGTVFAFCPLYGTLFACTTVEGTRLSTKKVIKRIVLHHATGPLAGLRQILGTIEGTRVQVMNSLRPSIQYGPRNALKTANHAKTHERYVEYREWAQAPTGRLNDFNPAQV